MHQKCAPKLGGVTFQKNRPVFQAQTSEAQGKGLVCSPRSLSMPNLVVIPPSGASFEMSLEKVRVTIGRSSRNEICLNDPFASRVHAEIHREKDHYYLYDNGSANGTFHNGVRIAGSAPLRPGDTVRIGETELQFLSDATHSLAGLSVELSDVDYTSQAEVTIVGRTHNDKGDNLLSVFTEIASFERQASDGRPGETAPPSRDIQQGDLLTVVSKVVETLLVEQTLDDTLNSILGLVFDAVAAERGYLFLTSENKELTLKSSRMTGGDPVAASDVKLSRAICNKVVNEGASVLTSDAQQDPRFSKSNSIALGNIRSIMAVPLATNDAVLGMIYVDSLYATNRFSQEDLSVLTTIARVAAIKVENSRLLEAQLEKRRLDEELKVASEIQLSLHPARPPQIEGYEIIGISFPCREIGGDYYDFIARRDGGWILALGDVSGKGTGAALMMSSLHAAMRAQSQTGRPVEEIVTEVNAYIVENSPENKFLTLFCAELHPESGRLTYTNAGHNPVLLVRGGGGYEELPAGGVPVGITCTFDYDAKTVEIRPGDILVIYSDGITESVNESDEEFGMERLAAIVSRDRKLTPSRIRDRIDEAISRFVGKMSAVDDMTLVILKRLERT
jgi:serine phosphatase RsbU (regulator of sigma subunit)